MDVISYVCLPVSCRAHRNDAEMQDLEFHDADNREAGPGATDGERQRQRQRSRRRRRSQGDCH